MKNPRDLGVSYTYLVELEGLKPSTSSMPWKHSNQLSYSPKYRLSYHKKRPCLKGLYFLCELLRAHPGLFVLEVFIFGLRKGPCAPANIHSMPQHKLYYKTMALFRLLCLTTGTQ